MQYTIKATHQGWEINDKVLITHGGVLYNTWQNEKPYKDFPQSYFELRDMLLNEVKQWNLNILHQTF